MDTKSPKNSIPVVRIVRESSGENAEPTVSALVRHKPRFALEGRLFYDLRPPSHARPPEDTRGACHEMFI